MLNRIRIVIIITLFPLLVNSQDLYNAYTLAKTIANYNLKSGKDSHALAPKIIGGVLWYASNDIDGISNTDEARAYISSHYPVLSQNLEGIISTMLDSTSILKLNETRLKELIRDTAKARSIISFSKRIQSLKFQIRSRNTEVSKLVDSLYKKMPAIRRSGLKPDQVLTSDSIRLLARLNTVQSILASNQTELDSTTSLLHKFVKANLSFEERLRFNEINIEYKLSNLFLEETEQLANSYEVLIQKQKADIEETVPPPSSFVMPSQSQLIDAMAIYLVKRVKQESVLWFFETLRRNGKNYDLVRAIFPNTCELLQSNEIYEAPKMGSLWRYAISKDFVTMPDNLLQSEWVRNKINPGNSYILSSLNTAIRFGRMIDQDYSYKDIITELYTNIPYSNASETATLNTLISFLYSLNAEFYKKVNKTTQRLQASDLFQMTDQEFEILVSLVDLKYNHVFRKLIFQGDTIDLRNTAKLNMIRKWIGGVLVKVQQFDSRRKELDRLRETVKDTDGQFHFTNNTTWKFAKDLLDGLLFNDPAFNTVYRTPQSGLQESLKFMGFMQEFFQMLEKKNFAGSVNVLFDIIKKISQPDEITITRDQLQSRLNQQRLKYYSPVKNQLFDHDIQQKFGYRLNSTGDTVYISRSSLLSYAFHTNDQNAMNVIRKLAGFLNDISVTRSSKELSRVIEAYALPAGSYKMKRDSWRSFDINAYVGMYGGHEWTNKDTLLKQQYRTAAVYGLTAPIGFAFSKTLGKKLPKNKTPSDLPEEYSHHTDRLRFSRNNIWARRSTTLTVFVSIIDIGAVVSYRFTNNDSILPQKLKWQQVFSPGAHFSVGVRGTPLVIAAGYEYTPSLRKLSVGSGKQLNMHRIHMGLLFDVPLFNIAYSAENSKRYKRNFFTR